MPVRSESREYAQDRLDRIVERNSRRYSYSRDYYIDRACNSVTRRMTNQVKLQVWADVLRDAGRNRTAEYAQERLDGLQAGTITRPVRTRAPRSTVPRYVPVPSPNPYPSDNGPRYVTFEFSALAHEVADGSV